MILSLTQEQALTVAAAWKAAGTDAFREIHGMQLRWAEADDGETVEFEVIATNGYVTVARGFDLPADRCRLGDDVKGAVVVKSARFFADALREIVKMVKKSGHTARGLILLQISDDVRITSEAGRAVFDVVLQPEGIFPDLLDNMPTNMVEAYTRGRRDLGALTRLRFDGFLPTMGLRQMKVMIDSTGDSLAKTADVWPYFLIPPTVEEGDNRQEKPWALMSVRKDGWWFGLIRPVRA